MKTSKINSLKIGLFTIFLTMASLTGYSQSCTGNKVTVTPREINYNHYSLKFIHFKTTIE
jgi:hypothetical protein